MASLNLKNHWWNLWTRFGTSRFTEKCEFPLTQDFYLRLLEVTREVNMLTKVKTNISNIWSSCESIRYFSWRRKKWESLNSFCLQYRHASQYSLNLFAQQLEMKFFNSKLKWWYPMKLPLEKSFSIDLFLYHKNWINFVPDFSFFFEQICTKFCILSSMPENMTSTTSQNENICHFLHYLSYLPELVLNYVLAYNDAKISKLEERVIKQQIFFRIYHCNWWRRVNSAQDWIPQKFFLERYF